MFINVSQSKLVNFNYIAVMIIRCHRLKTVNDLQGQTTTDSV